MTPEEYERIKQAEKEHLRKLKKLKDAHRQLNRQKKVTDAITDMTSSMREKLDLHEDMMDQIATESALNEARLEMAMEAGERKDAEAQAIKDELEIQKAKAKEIIRQMKAATGDPGPSVEGETQPVAAPKTGAKSNTGGSETPAPPSTKGSRKTAGAAPSTDHKPDLPEKTIGRMKP